MPESLQSIEPLHVSPAAHCLRLEIVAAFDNLSKHKPLQNRELDVA
jgi:hypothetical protein